MQGKRHHAPLSPGSYGPNVFVTGNSFFKWPKGTSTEMPASADISNWLVPSLGSRKLSIVTCMCSQHCLLPYMNMDNRGKRGIGGKNNYVYRFFGIRIRIVYRIVASRSTSRLVTCLGLFRLLMMGIFGPYVL